MNKNLSIILSFACCGQLFETRKHIFNIHHHLKIIRVLSLTCFMELGVCFEWLRTFKIYVETLSLTQQNLEVRILGGN